MAQPPAPPGGAASAGPIAPGEGAQGADKQRTVARTRVEMTHIILPQFTNSLGNVFGGQLMSWIDICAAIAAQRHCRGTVVTASIDAVHFIAPVRAGHIVILRGQLNATFRTSMECGVQVSMEDPMTGFSARAAKAYATFVRIHDDGHPMEVPPLALLGDEDHRRDVDARERRRVRLQMRSAARKG